MESVRLEFVGAVALSSAAVAQFVQALRDVPQDAECEIEEIRCRRLRERAACDEPATESVVRLHCAPPVAAFLCKRFALVQLLASAAALVLFSRGSASARLGSLRVPLDGAAHAETKSRTPELVTQRHGHAGLSVLPPPALPVDKVIAIIDVLGDQVADAHDAYELFALRDAAPPLRLTLLGLSKAMTRLCESEWVVKQTDAAASNDHHRRRQQQPRDAEDGTPAFATVSNLRTLLDKLIASSGVAMTALPASPTAPCLSYTDFLACYVALLHSIHSSATCA